MSSSTTKVLILTATLAWALPSHAHPDPELLERGRETREIFLKYQAAHNNALIADPDLDAGSEDCPPRLRTLWRNSGCALAFFESDQHKELKKVYKTPKQVQLTYGSDERLNSADPRPVMLINTFLGIDQLQLTVVYPPAAAGEAGPIRSRL